MKNLLQLEQTHCFDLVKKISTFLDRRAQIQLKLPQSARDDRRCSRGGGGQRRRGETESSPGQEPWLGPLPLDHIKRVGAASHGAVVEDEMQDAEHGKGDGQEEELHCHLAKHLGLKQGYIKSLFEE